MVPNGKSKHRRTDTSGLGGGGERGWGDLIIRLNNYSMPESGSVVQTCLNSSKKKNVHILLSNETVIIPKLVF